MRVLVLGGDGFCGWPTALHLSARGWDVCVVDNLSRRNIDNELEVQSLTPIRTMGERIAAWKEVSGQTIDFVNMTVGKEFDRLVALIKDWKPDSVVHFAEQRAAPYSMKSARHKLYTVDNNINATNHLLAAIVESGLDVHAARQPVRDRTALRETYLRPPNSISRNWNMLMKLMYRLSAP